MKRVFMRRRAAFAYCAVALATAVVIAPGIAQADDTSVEASGATVGLVAGMPAGSAASDASANDAKDVAAGSASRARHNKYVASKVNTTTKKGHILLNEKCVIAPASSVNMLSKALGANGSRVQAVSESKKGLTWKVQYERSKKAYIVKNVRTGKALAISGLASDGAAVVQAKVDPKNKNQLWLAASTATGYKLYPKANKSLALTVEGSNVKVCLSDDSASQRFWLFDPAGWSSSRVLKDGVYTLSPESDSAKLLGIKDNSARSGARAVLDANSKSLDHMFKISHVKGGYYKIQPLSTGFALTSSGGKVVQSKYAKKAAQLWKASVAPAGNIVFVNKKTKRVLDGSATKIATARAGVSSASAAQRWEVAPTTSGLTPIEQKALTYANTYRGRVKTNWYLSIDMSTHRLVLFQRKSKSSPWYIRKEITVSTARNGRDVVANRLTTGQKRYTNPPDNYSAYYWTGLGWGSWTHSILYRYGTHTVKDSRLGYSISWGCVRMKDENAKWIQDHIGKGSGVSSYY